MIRMQRGHRGEEQTVFKDGVSRGERRNRIYGLRSEDAVLYHLSAGALCFRQEKKGKKKKSTAFLPLSSSAGVPSIASSSSIDLFFHLFLSACASLLTHCQ